MSLPEIALEPLEPGGRTSGRPSAAGPILQPFAGIRFAESDYAKQSLLLSTSGEEATDSDVEILKRRDPRSILHLSWAQEQGLVQDQLRQWIAEGVLFADRTPQHYIYEYRVAGQLVRGVIGALDLRAPDVDRRVLPHEGLVESALDGFCRRVDEGRLDVEPVLLVQAFGDSVRDAVRAVTAAPPVLELFGPQDEYHRLWAVSDPGLHYLLTSGLSEVPALLADGHHRYAAHKCGPERPHGPGRVLAMVIDAQDAALALGPIHRIVPDLAPESVSDLLHRRGWSGSVETLVCSAATAEASFLLDPEAVFLLGGGNYWHLVGAEDQNPDVVQAHSRLFPLLDVVSSELEYRHAWESAVELAAVTGGTAVILKGMSFDEVLAVAQSDLTLPEKATSFSPKPQLAMVLCNLAAL